MKAPRFVLLALIMLACNQYAFAQVGQRSCQRDQGS
jgi:hypothetical protein